MLAAKIDAEMKKAALVIATADLLIGITGLHYGYGIGTRKVRQFRMIPGLQVLTLWLPIPSSSTFHTGAPLDD